MLKTDNVIYHTETQEDYDDLMVEFEKLGCEWWDGNNPTKQNYWNMYKEKSYIFLVHKKVSHINKAYLLKRWYPDAEIIKYKKGQKNMKVKLKASEQFVADWYEIAKGNLEFGIYSVHTDINNFGDSYIAKDTLLSWFNNKNNKPIETIMKMHLFGYEVEKEPLYTVTIPNPNSNTRFMLLKKGDDVIISKKTNMETVYGNTDYYLTEAEIKKDFEWAWQFAREVE